MPRDRIRLGSKVDVREARKDALKYERSLRPSKLEAEAEVHSCTEGEVRVWVVCDVKPVRALELRRIAVRCGRERCEHAAALERAPEQCSVAGRKTGFRHLHGRDIAQALLDADQH